MRRCIFSESELSTPSQKRQNELSINDRCPQWPCHSRVEISGMALKVHDLGKLFVTNIATKLRAWSEILQMGSFDILRNITM